ncbi:hypothetical protein F5Y04DRAFT_290958 [Hypomontagnella monticulosa]|nr:hypothetical protein F5Y04DRAFT_290958 [Hypomontagnella monticulosa]
MEATSKELVVSINDPMPHRYIFVPSGNRYITMQCRKRAAAENHPVYIVMDSKDQRVGTRVPTAVYEKVIQVAERTKESRLRAARARELRLRDELREAVKAQFPAAPLTEVYDVVDQAMEKYNRTHKLTMAEKGFIATLSYIRRKYTDYEAHASQGMPPAENRDKTSATTDAKVVEWGWVPKPGEPPRLPPSELDKVLREKAKRAPRGDPSVRRPQSFMGLKEAQDSSKISGYLPLKMHQ